MYMQTDGVKNTLNKVVSAEFDLPRYNLVSLVSNCTCPQSPPQLLFHTIQ